MLKLQPENPFLFLVQNFTSEDNTREMSQKNTLFTGKDDISQISKYIEYQNQTELIGFKFLGEKII